MQPCLLYEQGLGQKCFRIHFYMEPIYLIIIMWNCLYFMFRFLLIIECTKSISLSCWVVCNPYNVFVHSARSFFIKMIFCCVPLHHGLLIHHHFMSIFLPLHFAILNQWFIYVRFSPYSQCCFLSFVEENFSCVNLFEVKWCLSMK